MNSLHGQQSAGFSAPQQEAPIPRAVDLLHGSVNQLDADLTRLSERLHRVLRPAAPQPPAPAPHGTLAAVPSTSQLSEQIHMQNVLVERMSGFVRDLMDRLEA